MKLYKSGYVLGKFMPFHYGHKYLIDTAIEYSDKVTVVVGSLPTEPIPGSIRFKWVTEQYRTNPNVTVVHCDEVLPQYPEEHEDFWNIWVNVVKRYCPDDIDVIFTSETYGDPYAEHLGIKHHLVDLERHTFNISGTEVRANPLLNWFMIPDHVKPYFVKRVAIMGSESCGKSTLTKNLANYYNTNYVEEYGRTVYENNGNYVSVMDFAHISVGRQIIEDAMIKQANKLLFCDTEDLTTCLFLDMYYPDGNNLDAAKTTVKKFLWASLDQNKQYDLYILLKPDCEAVQDGTRNYLDDRWTHYNSIKSHLIDRGCVFIEVGGTWEERFNAARDEIKNKFFKRFT